MYENTKYEKPILILVYLLSSVITTVVNKYIISFLNFKMVFFYLGCQSFIVSFVLYALSLFEIVKIRSLRDKRALVWIPCSLLLITMIYTGMKSLEYLPISLFTLIKNFSIIIIAIGEYLLYKRTVDIYTIISFVLMIASSFIGNFTTIEITSIGYLWSLLNVLSTSAYILNLKYNIDTENTTNNESVFFCNAISIPFLFLGSILLDKFDDRLINLSIVTSKIYIVIFSSGFTAFLISYSTAWCLQLLSSTSLSMLGAINKLLVSFSGIIFLGERNLGFLKISSLFLGSLSGLIYTNRIKKE